MLIAPAENVYKETCKTCAFYFELQSVRVFRGREG